MKLNRNQKIGLFIFFLFIVFSILMLWPLPLYMTERLFSPVDPLLNTWIIAWDVHQLLRDPLNLFQANIFFPLENTLAFSENLFGLSVLAMPVVLLSKNPILGYNFIQLISFILCGFATYLLVFHLTKNRIAGFVAGVIFAFHPYRFRQLGHIQNIALFWMPLTFLYMHKFFKRPTYKHVFLFSLFFVLQALSCSYMGVFLSLSVGLAFFYYLFFMGRKFFTTKLIKRFVISIIVCALCIGPFLYPYIQVKKEHSFKRNIESNIRLSSNLLGYATISRFNNNVFYHQISRNLRKILFQTEKNTLRPIGRGLFPGIILIILVSLGFLSLSPSFTKERYFFKEREIKKKNIYLLIDRINNWLLVCNCLFIIVIVVSKGLSISVVGLSFSINHLTSPVYLLIFLSVVKVILSRYKEKVLGVKQKFFVADRNFYLFLAFVTFLLSLGPRIYFITRDFGDGPYTILYKYFFLFKGIRAPERFGIIVMLALCVLAGYGMKRIMALFKRKGKLFVCAIVTLFIMYEYICIPLQSTTISREPTNLYQWLSKDKDTYGILEYPFDTMQKNKYYMYFSTFHWKKLANGSSGFNPRLFIKLKRLAHEEKDFPNQKFIDYLKSRVPVRYLVLHLAGFTSEEKEKILHNTVQFSKDLILVKEFDQSDYVYEINYNSR